MMRQRHPAAGRWMPPDFMAPRPGPVKGPQAPRHLAILEPRQPAHQEIPTGMMNSLAPPSTIRDNAGGSGSPCSRHDSAIFLAKPCAISTASTMLRPSAQSRHIGARGDITAFRQGLDVQSSGDLAHSTPPQTSADTIRRSNLFNTPYPHIRADWKVLVNVVISCTWRH